MIVNIFGGTFGGDLVGLGDSVINIYGRDFNFDEGVIPVEQGRLTGTLASGDPIDIDFLLLGTGSIIHVHHVAIPEPATAMLGLAIGGVVVVATRRRAGR